MSQNSRFILDDLDDLDGPPAQALGAIIESSRAYFRALGVFRRQSQYSSMALDRFFFFDTTLQADRNASRIAEPLKIETTKRLNQLRW